MDRDEQLLAVASEAQNRIDDALGRMTPSEIEGSDFDQAGLRDGLKIVGDYLRVGEFGVAFDHVLYMVIETHISLTSDLPAFSGPRVPWNLLSRRLIVSDCISA